VTGFLGAGGKPQPVPDVEAERIRAQMQEASEHPRPTISFQIGENVRINDGAFASFTGTVEEVNEARSRVTVSVSIFGRSTPMELEFHQVEKA
jgi:transcriptional antiterminator NusG